VRDVAIHSAWHAHNGAIAAVLDFAASLSGLTWTMAFSRKRAKGLRLVARDIGWWSGTGPEVDGPGEAILMALNGRAGAVEELGGEGVPVPPGSRPDRGAACRTGGRLGTVSTRRMGVLTPPAVTVRTPSPVQSSRGFPSRRMYR